MTGAEAGERAQPRSDTTLRTVLAEAAETLSRAGVASPTADAELLLGHLLNVTRGRVQALAAGGAALTGQQTAELRPLLLRRAAREPLQHITGSAGFRTLQLAVGPGVFVPRPETEQVAQYAIDALRATAAAEPVAVDLGTGSGAIALALASEVPHARVLGVELSVDAYRWALRNLADSGLNNVTIVPADLEAALPERNGQVSVVVSNPPYIPDNAVPRDPEVRRYDPPSALYGGSDGLAVIRQVSAAAWRLLHPGGTVVIEHGDEQGPAVRMLLRTAGWHAVQTLPDLTGRDRAALALR